MIRPILAAAVAATLAFAAGSAAAATRIVNFTLGPDIASGEFSYDNSLTGVIDYDDLATFKLTFVGTGNTYDLAFVRSGDMSAYRGFAFDTASRTFSPTDVGGVPHIMSAIKNGFGAGFFVRANDEVFAATDYAIDEEMTFTSLEVTSRLVGAGVPEPTTWALMIAGFGLVGAGVRRRQPAHA
ncbi:MAG: PEPxxWA-CTERM sorting domain-containing protein [Pseudomonadota bacterium]